MDVKILNRGNVEIKQQRSGDAGFDLSANITDPITLNPLERKLIPTGIFLELPEQSEAQVRPRSGLAIKHGLTVLNSPGTIDHLYRGEIQVIMINLSNESYTIQPNERIAQLVFNNTLPKVNLIKVEIIDENTERGANGFGHSGKL